MGMHFFLLYEGRRESWGAIRHLVQAWASTVGCALCLEGCPEGCRQNGVMLQCLQGGWKGVPSP